MLTIRNLRFAYPGKTNQPLLDISSHTTPDSQHLLIQGNSGSGKTSLLFLLAGLLKPQSGAIEINGTDTATFSASQTDAFRGKHIGFIFQQPHLMPALTVLQNILVAPFMAGLKPDRAHAEFLLRKLGLADYAHRYPHQLSHGQQQRVGVARALVHRPALVLADEPTSALDDTACKATISLLLATATEAKAQLVVATHDSRLKPHFKTTLNLGAK